MRQLAQSFGARSAGIEVHTQIVEGNVGPDAAVPLGLLLNELVSNSFKHAYPDGRRGRILVRIESTEKGLLLTVSDNGVGLTPGVDPMNCSGLGLRLACGLAQQLGGRLQAESSNGARFSMVIAVERALNAAEALAED